MIKYQLVCDAGHDWEGWFQNSSAYDVQVGRGQVTCPVCATAKVSKAIMAPSIVAGRGRDDRQRLPASPAEGVAEQASASQSQDDLLTRMRKLRDEVRATAEYVGPRFAEEARKIHEAESPKRGIYGEASLDEVRSLAEDGIPCLPMPRLPEDLN